MASFSLRIDFDGSRSETRSIGPGKIRLLELVAETGSISAAGRAMQMSYRRAWLLIDALNRMFKHPVVTTRGGGQGGGGASLTPFGTELVASYRGMQDKVAAALTGDARSLEASLSDGS